MIRRKPLPQLAAKTPGINDLDLKRRDTRESELVSAKVIRDVIGFAFLCSVIVPKKLAPLSHQIRCTTKINHDLVTCVSPLFDWFLL